MANLASGKEQGTNETTKPTKQVVNIGKSMVAMLELSTQQSLHPSPGQRLDNRIQLSFNGSIMLLCALMPTNSTIDPKTLSMTPSTPVGRSLRLIFDDKDGEYGKKAHTRSGGLSGHQRTVLVHA